MAPQLVASVPTEMSAGQVMAGLMLSTTVTTALQVLSIRYQPEAAGDLHR